MVETLAQENSLLTTKLYIPQPRPSLVPRPRLIQRLDDGLRLRHRLTLVSAPPGFGKTTMVTEWVCATTHEVAWLSLDEGDNDPIQFLHYLVAALQQVDGRIGRALQPILGSPGFTQASVPSLDGLVAPLINDLLAASAALILVLDDYQLVTSTAVHQIVEFLLDHQPASMHTVLSTREDPPLPLHRWRVRGQVTEIRERDLRFTVEEAADFLTRTMSLPLNAGAVAALEARTEGWIAGLQLAALALQEDPGNTPAFIAAFTGDDRYVTEYLVAEVLQRQPAEVRAFMQQTAILDRLTAPLCDALTGRSDSQAVLEQLERANLFLVPLDHRREWYRYHRLFGEVLRATVAPAEQARLHRAAAGWYEAHGLKNQAIHHALAHAAASGEWDDAQQLIRLAVEDTLYAGNLLTVRGWLDALPVERLRTDGELATYLAWVLALTGEIDLAEDWVRIAKACLGPEKTGAAWGKLLALRSFIAVFVRGQYQSAIDLAAQALSVLDEDQARWHVIALWAMAESQERTTHITQAITTLHEARRTGRRLGNQVFAATVELFLAIDLHLHGKRRHAVAICHEAIDHYTDEQGHPSPVAGLIFCRLGALYYEANQLDRSRQYLDQGLALVEQIALAESTVFALGLAAPTLHAQGETATALATLEKAHQIAVQTGLADTTWILAQGASIRLQQGDLAAALRWAETAGLSPDDEPTYLGLEQHLVYARLLLARGRLSDVRRAMARYEHFTQERGLYRWLITVYLLQALAAERGGDRPTAHDRLARALDLAAPEDYVRAFLDEDPQVLALLPGVRHVAPAFVDRLLGTLWRPDPDSTIRIGTVDPLVEPLSEREIEVLRLIAAGLTNREIADELVIAIGTVKRHTNNLYGKLGVHSRTQATARARDLDLI